MKNQLTVLCLFVFAWLPFSTHGQGVLNGSFELYSPETQFLVGWHARGGAGKDYGAVVGGVSGSLIAYGWAQEQGLLAHILGPEAGLNGIPVGSYWFAGRGPATTVEQQFLVPEDTRSLQYRALGGYLGGVSVQIDGVTLEPLLKAIIQPGSAQAGEIEDWWVDVRPYAGKQVNLTFYIGQGNAGFDDVRVSTELVPEPGVMSLGALGAVALLTGSRKRIRGR